MRSLLLTLLLLPAALWAQTVAIDGFAAMVNGKIITAGDVLEYTSAQRREARRRFAGRELSEELARIYELGLERLIENRLILESFEALGGQLPEAAIRERTDTILRERFSNDRSQLLSTLRGIGMTEREWRNDIRDQVVVQQLTQQFVTRRVNVPPREVKERFDADPERFVTPREYRLLAISLRPVPEEELEERIAWMNQLRRELLDGADFGDVAREHSQGANAREGGDQGWIKLDSLPGTLAGSIAHLRAGEISELVFTPTQHFLFKVEDVRGGEALSLGEAQATLEAELRREMFDRLYADWMTELRRRFPVTVFSPREETIQRGP